MCPKEANNPKLAQETTGDDAGFLSWLGISFGDQPTETVAQEVDTEKEPIEEEVTPTVYAKEDIVPTIKEARVVSRWNKKEKIETPTPPKTKLPRDAVGEFIKQKTKEHQDLDRSSFQRSKPSFKKWARRSDQIKSHHFRSKDWGETNAAISIWTTKRTTKSKFVNSALKTEKIYKVSDSLKKKETIVIGGSVTVKEFSEKMWVPLPEVMKVLLANKILVWAQANIDFDTASLIAGEFEVTVEKQAVDMTVNDLLSGDLQAILESDKGAETLEARPPIVTIMGHVDHGKTKLLDYLRQTNIIGDEAGGITQSIWASQIVHNEQKITFIDTPWHELFTSLRARWAKITDIVVIVVAADDGIKPQTIEAINHAKDAGVPIIVAITKIDLWTSKIDDIKGQLAAQWLQPEERWGDIILIPCSAMTGQGIDDLLDAILLQYELLEHKCNPARAAVGVVVEANKNSKQWVMTSLLIMTGTLHIWDIVVIHNTSGRVRKMTDRQGKDLTEATGGDPVMILGIQDLPEPWRIAEVVSTEKDAVKKIALIQEHEQTQSKETIIHSLLEQIGKWDNVQVKLLLKADSVGSLEAIKMATGKIIPPENVDITIVHTDVGAIHDSDLSFAQAAKAIIIGYNVDAGSRLKKKAEQLKVPIKSFDIIYQYIDYLTQLTEGLIEKEKVEVILGKLEVLAIFFKKGREMIFGGKVTEGKIKNGAQFTVTNRTTESEDDEEGKEITGTITSLQREQNNVNEVAQGHECGMKTKVNKKIEIGDILEFRIWE